MSAPSDQDVIRELRDRADVRPPAMSLDTEAVRTGARRRLWRRRGALGAATLTVIGLLSVAVGTPGWPQSSNVAGPPSTSPSQGACVTAPAVEYSIPGMSSRRLATGASVTITAGVGQAVTIRFVGECADGGRLMISDPPQPGGGPAFTGLWTGQSSGTWTPTEPGTKILAPAWSCYGGDPIPCPLATLGTIEVHTPE